MKYSRKSVITFANIFSDDITMCYFSRHSRGTRCSHTHCLCRIFCTRASSRTLTEFLFLLRIFAETQARSLTGCWIPPTSNKAMNTGYVSRLKQKAQRQLLQVAELNFKDVDNRKLCPIVSDDFAVRSPGTRALISVQATLSLSHQHHLKKSSHENNLTDSWLGEGHHPREESRVTNGSCVTETGQTWLIGLGTSRKQRHGTLFTCMIDLRVLMCSLYTVEQRKFVTVHGGILKWKQTTFFSNCLEFIFQQK